MFLVSAWKKRTKRYSFIKRLRKISLLPSLIVELIFDHKDLKGKIWTNEKEIPGNGIDDDHNGYIDDIHGWNFLGNSKGEDIGYETYESVRIKRQYDSVYGNIYSASQIPQNQLDTFSLYWACRKDYDEKLDKYENIRTKLNSLQEPLSNSYSVIEDYLRKKDFTKDDLSSIHSSDPRIKASKKYLFKLYRRGFTYGDFMDMRLEDSIQLNYNLNIDFDPRELINDNPDDINDRNYGNNDVKGPDPFHGTFVSGIIAANRNNNTGIDGIAQNVRIMVLRVVPDGDERDKDIALAIYYAADNGARIINMSFGKYFSPGKKMVDDAIRYAAGKNVLIVHAAGNEALNVDYNLNFPTNKLSDSIIVRNYINVGASTMKKDKNLCAFFSNYGQRNVDMFAPGFQMISITTNNKYTEGNGTSFACPVVSGIAALILSYYPELSAVELRNIIMESCLPGPNLKVYIPDQGSDKRKKVPFKDLSETGGIPNVYKALLIAEQLQAKNKSLAGK